MPLFGECEAASGRGAGSAGGGALGSSSPPVVRRLCAVLAAAGAHAAGGVGWLGARLPRPPHTLPLAPAPPRAPPPRHVRLYGTDCGGCAVPLQSLGLWDNVGVPRSKWGTKQEPGPEWYNAASAPQCVYPPRNTHARARAGLPRLAGVVCCVHVRRRCTLLHAATQQTVPVFRPGDARAMPLTLAARSAATALAEARSSAR